ncbi:apolipoprotein N-acyltransferase [Syntrophotalea acetylenivorans]|uniref:Apolipoprotein N-acyltransferase n=1 Tax=Syntrophotalea acetylenivorans TaxID=1842532 RepID=A0A1L3GMY5_9BACT|nr:apolipoprotein N-acyltransferase [Syntrophotalea acetylenivorans]APG27255.1 apolipoprotein N-acyltransferase [Syntrophotalea acetylenivorans]
MLRVLRRLPIDKTDCWSLFAGLLLAFSFPRPDLASVAWFGLVPLFVVMERRPFRSGFLAGIGFFGLVLYWLNIVMTTYGRLHPVLSVVAYLLLVAYLALFFGGATWAASRFRQRLGLAPTLTLPVFWVALEFLRSFLLSGFPWATLGYSQQSHLLLIQSADLCGPYGLSFLLILSNATLAALWQARGQGVRRDFPRIAVTATALLFLANLGYGTLRLASQPDEREHTLTTVLAQGCIDQSVKWNPAYQQRTVDIYRQLSLPAEDGDDSELIIWPESAMPFYFQQGGPLSAAVTDVPRASSAYLLFGSPAFEVINRRPRNLNSAFLLGPDGGVLGRSDKVHLVPFGEYVPLGRFLPFIDKLVVGIGDFAPGTISPLPMNGHHLGVLVCFEGIFPELAREYVRRGSDLLVNITNDAWFGRSSAPYQHLAMCRFRAVENRVWLARAANTGISALISPSGRITTQSPLFERLALRGEVGLGARPSFYTRYGDLLPAVLLVLSGWWLWRARGPK